MWLYLGFAFIFAAWGAQIYQVLFKKDRTVNLLLPAFYGIGSLLLFIGSFIDGEAINGILNILCAILVMILIAVLLSSKTRQ
jgi:hypothetical protein